MYGYSSLLIKTASQPLRGIKIGYFRILKTIRARDAVGFASLTGSLVLIDAKSRLLMTSENPGRLEWWEPLKGSGVNTSLYKFPNCRIMITSQRVGTAMQQVM